jgi:hypothetical protein
MHRTCKARREGIVLEGQTATYSDLPANYAANCSADDSRLHRRDAHVMQRGLYHKLWSTLDRKGLVVHDCSAAEQIGASDICS